MFLVDTYCGYNYKNPNYDLIDRPNGSGDYLFLLFLHPMRVRLHNEFIYTKPNACILFSPGAPQYYGKVETFYNSFIHFKADPLELASFSIPENTIFYPPNTDELNAFFKLIQAQFYTKEPFYLEEMDALVRQLFIHLHRSMQLTSPIRQEKNPYDLLKQVRINILSDANYPWTAHSMAELSFMSTSQFYYYYKLFFNSTPKADILEARLTQAKVLLLDHSLSIQDVAHQSGFHDLPHFSRSFKKHFGFSPRNYLCNQTNISPTPRLPLG